MKTPDLPNTATARRLIEQNYRSQYVAESITPHAQGGFSGACIWRVEAPAGEFCLRRWPAEHPTPQRLQFIHRVLFHAVQHGCQLLAVPVIALGGNSFFEHQGRLWELAPWLPGSPRSADQVTHAEVAASMHALAKFHASTATWEQGPARYASSPAVEQRLMAMQWFDTWAESLREKPLQAEQRLILDAYLQRRSQLRRDLTAATELGVSLQPCLRDIWSDHMLFQHDHVTGIIDYGAMSVDSPATDMARLLGSYAGNRAEFWQRGLKAYAEHVNCDVALHQLIATLDLSSAVLSGMNWLDWLHVQRRTFTDLPAVHARLGAIATRLTDLPSRAAEHWVFREE